MYITKIYKVILCLSLLVILFSQNPAYAESESVTFCGIGNSYYDKGQMDLAITNYTQAIGLNPQYTKAYYNRGLAYYVTSQYDLAVADFTKAIALNPQYEKAYYYRGKSRVFLVNQRQLAADDYTRAIALNPQNIDYYLARAEAYRGISNYLAVEDYNHILRMKPGDFKASTDKHDLIEFSRVGEPNFSYDPSYNPFSKN